MSLNHEEGQLTHFKTEMTAKHEQDYLLAPITHKLRLILNDSGVNVPLSSTQFVHRVFNRLGTQWMVHTIDAITDERWATFIEEMPHLAAGKKYTLRFVFTEAWAVACDACHVEEEETTDVAASGDSIPTIEAYEKALSSILQWPISDVSVLSESIRSFRDAAVYVLQEKSTYVDLEAQFETISFKMSHEQYQSMLAFVSCLARYSIKAQYADLRPQQSVKSNPRAWWRYAIESNRRQVRQRLSRIDWSRVVKRRTQRARYMELYIQQSVSKLDDNGRDEFDRLEDDLDLDEIVSYRKRAIEKVKQERSEHASTNSGSSYFSYSYWFGSSKETGGELLSSLSDAERTAVYDAIDSNVKGMEDSTVLVRVRAQLRRVDVKLDMKDSPLIAAHIDGLDVEYLQRNDSKEIGLLLEDVAVVDKWTERSIQSTIIDRMALEDAARLNPGLQLPGLRLKECENRLPLLRLNIELHSTQEVPMKVAIVSQPLNVIFYLPYILQLGSFFSRPTNIDLSAIDAVAWENAQALTTYSAAQLRVAISERRALLLEVDATSPMIRIVEHCGMIDGVELTVFLGHMHAISEVQGQGTVPPSNHERTLADFNRSMSLDQMYDKINCSLDGIQAIVSNQGDPGTAFTVIHRTSVGFTLNTSIAPNDPTIPWIRLVGDLDRLELNLSSTAYLRLLALAAFFSESLIEADAAVATVEAVRHLLEESESQQLVRASSSLTNDDAILLWNRVTLFLRFSIGQVVLCLVQDELELIRAYIANIEIELTQRSYDRLFSFIMGSFDVEDHLFHRLNASVGDVPYLVSSTGAGQSLIRIKMGMISPDLPPDLKPIAKNTCLTKEEETSSLPWHASLIPGTPLAIDMSLHSLTFKLHQETVGEIIRFFLHQKQPEEIEEYIEEQAVSEIHSSPSDSHNNSFRLREWAASVLSAETAVPKETKSPVVQIQLRIFVEHLAVVLVESDRSSLASIAVEGFGSNIEQSEEKMHVSAALGLVRVTDLIVGSQIIGALDKSQSSGDPMLFASYQSEGKVVVRLSAPHIRLVYRFVEDLQRYLLFGPMKAALDSLNPPEAANLTRLTPLVEEEPSIQLPKLNIVLTDGVIDLPRDSRSNECLSLVFERIVIENEAASLHKVELSISEIRIVTISNELQRLSLLGGTDIMVTANLSQPFKIDVVGQPIRFVCSEFQYQMLLSIPASNWNEANHMIQYHAKATAPPPPTNASNATEIYLKVEIPEISMELLSGNNGYQPTNTGDLAIAKRADSNSIAVLNIENIQVQLSNCSPSVDQSLLTINACIDTVTAYDSRPGCAVSETYRTLFILKSKTDPAISIIFESETANDDRTSGQAKIQLIGIKLIPSPVVFDLISFFSGSPAEEKKSIPPTITATTTSNMSEVGSKFTIGLEIQLRDSSILLVEDNTLDHSREVLFSWIADCKLGLGQNGLNVQLILDEIRATSRLQRGVLFKVAKTSVSASDCIKPFKLTCSFIQDTAQSSVVLVDCSSIIEINLGYLDCTTITSAVSTLLPPSAVEDKPSAHEYNRMIPVGPAADPVMYGGTKFQLVDSMYDEDSVLGYYTSRQRKYLMRMTGNTDENHFEEMEFMFMSTLFNSNVVRFGDVVQLCDTAGQVIQKYNFISASGYLGPDSAASDPFLFRIWRDTSTALNSDRSVVRIGDTMVFESVTVYTKTESSGGFLMYNGHGDAPVPFTLRIKPTEIGSTVSEMISIASTTHFKLGIPGVSATIVNDANNRHLPLFHCRLNTIEAEVRGRNSRQSAIVSIECQLSFYNYILSVWEPLIEPWTVHVAMHSNGGIICSSCLENTEEDSHCPIRSVPCILSRKKLRVFGDAAGRARDSKRRIRRELLDQTNSSNVDKSTTILIVTPHSLNVNISPLVLQVLAQFLAVFGSPEQVERSDSLGSYICVDNQSGIEFEYGSTADEWTSIPPEKCQPTDLIAHLGPVGRVTGIIRRHIWIRPKDKIKCEPVLAPVSCSNEDPAAFKLLPNTNYDLICDTVAEQGTLVLRIRSKVIFQNHLPTPVQLIYYYSNDQVIKLKVEAHGIHYVPLIVLEEHATICIDSTRLNLVSLLDETNVLKHIVSENSNSRSLLVAQNSKLDLHPLIVLENLLPVSINYRFITVDQDENIMSASVNPSKPSTAGELKSGASEAVCESNNHTDSSSIAFSISIPSIGCKKSVMSYDSVVYGPLQSIESLNVVDERGNAIQIRVELERIVPDLVTGPVICRVYVEFWMIDKTELGLIYSQRPHSSREIHPTTSLPLTLMSSDLKTGSQGSKVAVRLNSHKNWSKSFEIGTVGVYGQLTLPDEPRYEIGVGIDPSPDQYSRTTMVTFSPRYRIFNQTKKTIQLRQTGVSSDQIIELLPSRETVYHWTDGYAAVKRIQLRLGKTSTWTGGFELNSVGEFLLRVSHSSESEEIPDAIVANSTEFSYIHVEIQLLDPILVILLRDRTEPFISPYKIRNECHACSLHVSQIGSGEIYDVVPPFTDSELLLHEPMGSTEIGIQFRHVDIFKEKNKCIGSTVVKVDKPKRFPVVEFSDVSIWIEVFIEAATRVIRVTDVLPGQTEEHRRRARSMFLTHWRLLKRNLELAKETLVPCVETEGSGFLALRIIEGRNFDRFGLPELKKKAPLIVVKTGTRQYKVYPEKDATSELWIPKDSISIHVDQFEKPIEIEIHQQTGGMWGASTSSCLAKVKLNVCQVNETDVWIPIATSEVRIQMIMGKDLTTVHQREEYLHKKHLIDEATTLKTRYQNKLDSDNYNAISEADAEEEMEANNLDPAALVVMLMNVSDFHIRDESHTSLYCAVTYGDSTRSTDVAVANECTNQDDDEKESRIVNVTVDPAKTLGLELTRDFVIRAIQRDSQCSTMAGVEIGDHLVAINGEEITSLDVPIHEIRLKKKKKPVTNRYFTADWNRSVTFDKCNTPRDRLHVEIYAKNPALEQDFTMDQEATVVPFLYFLGQDETLAKLNHSVHHNFDTCIAECWVRLPPTDGDDGDHSKSFDQECALYDKRTRDIIGKIRIISKYDTPTISYPSEIETFFHLDLAGIGISLVDTHELLYLSIQDAELTLASCSNKKQLVNVQIDHFQIDNQLIETNFPVLLYPSTQDEPTVQIMAVLSTDTSATHVVHFDYILIQLVPLEIQLEDVLLVAVLNFLLGIQFDDTSQDLTYRDPNGDGNNILARVASSQVSEAISHSDEKIVIGWLFLCPLRCNITFSSTSEKPLLDSLVSKQFGTILRTILNAAATVVTNLDHAPLEIPELYSENLFETSHALLFYILQHYTTHGLRSVYKMIGSVDFLGNPVGLVSTLGTGVKDFFYTPAQMLLENEDGLKIENLRTGMTKGSKSLLKNTAVGIFHTTGKITETLGKGVAMLAMDSEYNAQRQKRLMKQNVENLGDGIVEGGKGLAGGVWEGIKGIVYDPVKGAETDGAGGFVVGLGKGVAGLIVKPTAGVLDLLTSISQGVHNTAAAVDPDSNILHRIRLPRRFGPDQVLVQYSEREAEGNAILTLHGSPSEIYLYHVYCGEENHRGIVMLTDQRILCTGARKGCDKIWELPNDSTLQVVAAGHILSIHHGNHKALNVLCDDEIVASRFQLAVESSRDDPIMTRYLLLNIELSNRALHPATVLEPGQLTQCAEYLAHVTQDDLRAQPLRTVRVEALPSTDLKTISVLSSCVWDNLCSFTIYKITVLGGPYEWTIYRRFRDFRQLDQDLQSIGCDTSALPNLPTRTLFWSTRESVIKQRQEALGIYLQSGIFMDSVLSQAPVVLDFITTDAHQIRLGSL